jgi:hypothetical protein
MAKAQVTVPLDISDVRVLKTEMNKEGELIITIETLFLRNRGMILFNNARAGSF